MRKEGHGDNKQPQPQPQQQQQQQQQQQPQRRHRQSVGEIQSQLLPPNVRAPGIPERSNSKSNRASLVFQQLHASVVPAVVGTVGLHPPSYPGYAQPMAQPMASPPAMRRSFTEGATTATGGLGAQTRPWWVVDEIGIAPKPDGGSEESEGDASNQTEPTEPVDSSSGSSVNTFSAVVDEGSALLGGHASSATTNTSNRQWRLSDEWAAVLKAVLAYAIAALFPFVPFLREWLGDPEYMSPHLVTNATIWFHAAKTRSGLAEGGLVGALWVCATSLVTYTALFVGERLHAVYSIPGADLAWQSKAVSLGVFVFGFSWVLAFFKANAARPSVGTATAIANIALYLVMLREAPVVNQTDGVGESVGRKSAHVLVAVLTGMAVSLAVGWTVRPTTAAQELRRQLQTTLASFGAVLPQLLAPIVSADAPAGGREKLHGAKPLELKDALRMHRQRLQQLRRHADAVSLEPTEWSVWARRAQARALVACLDGLSLHLSTLSCGLELRAAESGSVDAAAYAEVIGRIRAPVVRLGAACEAALAAAAELVDEALAGSIAGADRRVAAVRAAAAGALRTFQADYDAAVGGLGGKQPLGGSPGGGKQPPASSGNGDSVRTTEELLFTVYFFVFSLREFADELLSALLPAVAALCRTPPTPRQMLARELRSPRRLGQHVRRALRWAAGRVRVLCDTGATTELESRYEVAQFADPRSLHARRPSAEPSAVQRLARGIWHACMWARRLNVRFATKYALLVTALSLPCYWSLDVYWEFRRQRLEWMVISAAAIMVPTVGGSLLVSAYRILGTCVGGLAAFLVYEVGRDCPVLTYTLLVLFSVPCFRIILHGNYPKIGQFALITFGVILINKWVANEDRDESVAGLAVRRTMSVALGVLAGMLVTLYVWPYEARVRVRQALSWWMLTALLLYDQLWRALWAATAVPVSDAAAAGAQPSVSEAAIGAQSSVPADRWTALGTVRDYLDGEMQLQSALVEIRSLLSDTLNEPRLKGPFPLISYQRIINACQRLLDAMVAARWVMLPVPMAVVAQHLHPTASTSDTSDDDDNEEESSTSIKIAAAGFESGRMNMPDGDGDGDDTASDEGASMLDLPIDLSSTVLMERGEQADMDGRLGQVIASAAAVSEDSAEYIRLRVERDLLRQSAAEREHRDALLSLTMYVLASALILKTPLPSVLPPIHAAQRRVADAMRDILVGDEPEISVGEADAAAQRAVDRIRYVFYYTQVMLGWEVVQELSIIGGLMRELYGSYGSFGNMSE